MNHRDEWNVIYRRLWDTYYKCPSQQLVTCSGQQVGQRNSPNKSKKFVRHMDGHLHKICVTFLRGFGHAKLTSLRTNVCARVGDRLRAVKCFKILNTSDKKCRKPYANDCIRSQPEPMAFAERLHNVQEVKRHIELAQTDLTEMSTRSRMNDTKLFSDNVQCIFIAERRIELTELTF